MVYQSESYGLVLRLIRYLAKDECRRWKEDGTSNVPVFDLVAETDRYYPDIPLETSPCLLSTITLTYKCASITPTGLSTEAFDSVSTKLALGKATYIIAGRCCAQGATRSISIRYHAGETRPALATSLTRASSTCPPDALECTTI